jgi:flagellar basal-body rod protein FlgF
MGDFVNSVGSILSRVERRVEVAGQNISNVTTPGYKRAVSFETMVGAPDAGFTGSDSGVSLGARIAAQVAIDSAAGQLQVTDNPDNLAISGTGFFSVRAQGGAVQYTRHGQFQRTEAGHLVNAEGAVLQQSGGGDLVLKSGNYTVVADGTVLQAGEAIGRIGIVDIADKAALTYAENGLYTAPEGMVSVMENASVIQGSLEASNVSLGTEMMTVMAALREAQTGQRLMMVYDELMGRAITTFGQA